MTTRTLLTLAAVCLMVFSKSQSIQHLADSIRQKYKIPELAFAVVTPDKVLELQVIGTRKINSDLAAGVNDKFRLGSNTKILTGFIAATLVKQEKIKWNTKFFDLFPQFKSKAKKSYHDLTLLNLLSFRNKLIRWTYTDDKPRAEDIKGNEEDQRTQFIKWIFAHEPNTEAGEINFSNPAYVAAGMMLEKCSGKSYKTLVTELGKQIDVDFDFGPPNLLDSVAQPWGHNAGLIPEAPLENVRLNWLLPAGNVQVSLPGFCKFIQLQMRGLDGKSELLKKEEFEFLFTGLPSYSVGWFAATDSQRRPYYWHIGNPGTFLSRVYVFKTTGKAFVLFSNCQSESADRGLDQVFEELRRRYPD